MKFSDNALLANALDLQKNAIINAIQKAEDGNQLEEAKATLDFVAGVWGAVGYGYKLLDIRILLQTKARYLATEERGYLSRCRKNCRSRVGAEQNLAKLELLS